MEQVSVQEVISKAKGDGKSERKGRVEGGQEQKRDLEVVKIHLAHLELLYIAAKSASSDLSSEISNVAEASGYNAQNVRSLVAARVNKSFADKKRAIAQQLELFALDKNYG